MTEAGPVTGASTPSELAGTQAERTGFVTVTFTCEQLVEAIPSTESLIPAK
jgi:hypothetical protein